ncbi:SpaA isopeptide-forming pilin-related protein [Paenibacillus nasutitermitis]|uniref:Gram-positive cocci surface proteins LPxTG domain-containing protein n=1 Tax=Paenibacillus nasutitermitis TaxID=1652958 RepID=A0A917DYX1_9BACL|nr:SpaA isopeptide-forming pilin-related protein [Paenibacillus nasutitermitis]GGD81836.1 hypothetical protein GCM10010911_44940 [Paenibacillus nasutitermitis]
MRTFQASKRADSALLRYLRALGSGPAGKGGAFDTVKRATAMFIAFLLVFQFVNTAGVTQRASAAGSIQESIINEVKLFKTEPEDSVVAYVYKSVTEAVYTVNPEIRIEIGETLKLEYGYKLPEGHGYGNGDTYEFPLPAGFEYPDTTSTPKDLIAPAGQDSVGTYSVTNKVVTITFNNNIVGQPVEGMLGFWSNISHASVGNQTTVPVNIDGFGTINLYVKPENGQSIIKTGQADKAINQTEIEWTIDVNTSLDTVTDAAIVDQLPPGLTFTSAELRQLDVQSNGQVTGSGTPVNPQPAIAPDANGKIIVPLGDINSAYRLVVKTSINQVDRIDGKEFKNTAALTSGGNTVKQDDAAINYKKGEFLQKQSTGYDAANQIISWEIKFNYGEEALNPASIVDLFPNILSLDGTIEIVKIPDPNNDSGEVPVAGGYTLTLNPNQGQVDSAIPQFVTKPSVSGKNGFVLSFDGGTNAAYKIRYKTKANPNIYPDTDTDDINIENAVFSGDKSATSWRQMTQRFFTKTDENVNYANKTVDWKVEINQNGYNLTDVEFTDSFTGEQLSVKPETIKVNGQSLYPAAPSGYTLTFNDPADYSKGFSIKFPNGATKYEVTYTTNYDIDNSKYYTNGPSFHNEGGLYWRAGGDLLDTTIVADFDPNKPTINNGYKSGVYNAQDKTITWKIGVNYNRKQMANLVVEDLLKAPQKYQSVNVYELTVNADGSVTRGAPYTTFTPGTAAVGKDTKLTVTFNTTVTKAYEIEVVTDVENVEFDSSNKDYLEIANTATFTATGFPQKSVNANVKVPNAGEYVSKKGEQVQGNLYLVKWQVNINRGQSTVKKAVLTDNPSPGQILVEDSFILYQAEVTNSTTGEIAIKKVGGVDQLVNANDYEIKVETVSGLKQFTLTFKNALETITRPYILVYNSVADVKNGEKISNAVNFKWDGNSAAGSNINEEIEIKLFGDIGTGSTIQHNLKITKEDAANSTLKLPGAQFTLLQKSTNTYIESAPNNKTFTTNASGELFIDKLRYGTYILKEIKAPNNYVLNGGTNDEYEIVVSPSSSDITVGGKKYQPVVIKNNKGVGSIKLVKKDAVSGTPLSGAVFELKDPALQSFNPKKFLYTGADGTDTFSGLEYGVYYLQEVTAPTYYKLISAPVKVTLTSTTNNYTHTETITNERLKGSLEVYKVDAANNAPLTGATFQLEDSAGNMYTPTVTGYKHVFTNIPYGPYTLTETKAPAYYVIASDRTVTINNPTATENVTNTRGVGSLKVLKTNADGSMNLPGAEFKLTGITNPGFQAVTLSSDSNGEILFTNLPYGQYSLLETKAPEFYSLNTPNNPIAVTIDDPLTQANHVIITETVKNSRGSGVIEITKVDALDSSITLEGAEFNIYKASDTTQSIIIDTLITDAAGKAVSKVLEYDNYVIVETKSPKYYEIKTASVAVKLDQPEVKQTIENDRAKGSIEVIKLDKDDHSQLLDGAVFELDKVNSDNTRTQIGTTYATVNGKLTIDDLEQGKYELREINAPAHYVLNSPNTPISVELDQSNVSTTIENKRGMGSITVEKVDSVNPNEKLQGAVFELRTAQGNLLIDTQTTGINGVAAFNNLIYDNYVLVEISAPADYDLSSAPVAVTLDENVKLVMVKNKKSEGDLVINKVDKDNNAVKLAGAEFELKSVDGTTSYGIHTTDSNGQITFGNMIYGTYVLHEVKAPTYYLPLQAPITVIVDKASNSYTVENARGIGELTVIKVDANDSTLLQGAEFELLSLDKSISYGKKTIGEDGQLTFSNLAYNPYVLKELTPPSGYQINGSGELIVTVDSVTKSVTVSNQREAIAVPKGSLVVSKVDAADQKPLAGAQFELFASLSNESLGVATTDASGKASFSNLPYGDYVLVEKQAPAGYIATGGDLTVTIMSDSKNVTVTNNKENAPNPDPGPGTNPGPGPDPDPTVTPEPEPDPEPTPTPTPTPGPGTPTIVDKTTEGVPVGGKVDVPEGGTAAPGKLPENGKLTVSKDGKWTYTPNPDFKGRDTFSIIVTDKDGNEEEILFEIGVDEIPLGTVSGDSPGEDGPLPAQLPKTGENSPLLFQLMGVALILAGLTTLVIRKRRKSGSIQS